MNEAKNCKEPPTQEQLAILKKFHVRVGYPLDRELADLIIMSKGATPRQLVCLESMGIDVDGPISRAEASSLIDENTYKPWLLPPTTKQMEFLKARGKWFEGMKRDEASRRIGGIKAKERP